MKAYFEVITVCKARANWTYFWRTFGLKELRQDQHSVSASMTLRAKMGFRGTVSLHQKHAKHFDATYSYTINRLLIARIDTDASCPPAERKRVIAADFNSKQVLSQEVDLEPGTYAVLAEVGSLNAKRVDPAELFTLSFYGSHSEVEFGDCAFDRKSFVSDYIRSHSSEFKTNNSDLGYKRLFGDFFGYVCLYYENYGEKKITEEIEYTVKNVFIT